MIEMFSPSMDDYLFVIDFRDDFYIISKQAADRFQMESNSFHHVIENHRKFVHPDDMPELEKELQELKMGERETHDLTYRWISKEGTPVWINCRGWVVQEDGRATYMTGCINEVGTKQLADNDSGLMIESGLREYLSNRIPDSVTEGYLMRLGIDDLKEINARLGVEYGDRVLQKTSECISACIEPGQMLFRILGDEYMILDFRGQTSHDAHALYHRICQKLEASVAENNYEAVLTISAGILCCSDIGDFSYNNIMKLTEFALDEAKRQGKNISYLFHEEDYAKFLRREELTRRLRQSVRKDFAGFEVYYQPLYTVGDRKLYGAEALMRFSAEGMGRISPAEFIPLLEETGLIIPAGRWILHQALQACRDFSEYIPDFHMNINLSSIQIRKSNICDMILDAIEEYEVEPSQVTIELTESDLLESDSRFESFWRRLKESGVQVALDDFGTGYSNFRYIMLLKPDIIKIDRSFTAKALENEFEYNLLFLFAKMAHDLKLKVCVEGIESEYELEIISRLKPDYVQGFYFGHPVAYETFEEQFLRKAFQEPSAD
jgi:diguanylate cyclase (GGDEF)-like protein